VFTPRQVPLHPEDQKIVEYACDLCRQLNATKLDPRTVSWVNRMLTTQIIIFQSNIMLPRQLMGQLTPEEWRPLLASSIIYYGKFRARPMIRSFFLPMSLPVFVLTAVLLVIPRVSGPVYQGLLFATVTGYALFTLFMMRRFFFGTMRGFHFVADAKAAEIVGREPFIQVLSKIDALKLDYRPRFLGGLTFSPTARQRLEKLKENTTVAAG